MILDWNTPGIAKVLFKYGTRELLDTWIVKQEVGGVMNVLDIGGNIGYYVLLEASLLKGGNVYAFEPDPRNFRILQENIAMNKFAAQVRAYPFAAGSRNGAADFYLAEKANLSTFVPTKKGKKTLSVRTIRLDDFEHIQKIDFLRMDIEGYEGQVIDGMERFLEQGRPLKMLIEVHPDVYGLEGFRFQDRLKKLGDLGFHVKYLISAGRPRIQEIVDRGYLPVRSVQEEHLGHGLYENVSMAHLIEFLDNERKIVRSILLSRT